MKPVSVRRSNATEPRRRTASVTAWRTSAGGLSTGGGGGEGGVGSPGWVFGPESPGGVVGESAGFGVTAATGGPAGGRGQNTTARTAPTASSNAAAPAIPAQGQTDRDGRAFG